MNPGMTLRKVDPLYPNPFSPIQLSILLAIFLGIYLFYTWHMNTGMTLWKVDISIVYLAHESWDDPVEGGSLVSESLLSSTESPEVLRSLGNNITSKLHGHSTINQY